VMRRIARVLVLAAVFGGCLGSPDEASHSSSVTVVLKAIAVTPQSVTLYDGGVVALKVTGF